MPKIAGSTLGLVFYFFFVQHIKLSYFNTFKSTCDFWTMNLTDLDAFALRIRRFALWIRPPSECNELWREVLGRSPRLGFSKLELGLGLVLGLGLGLYFVFTVKLSVSRRFYYSFDPILANHKRIRWRVRGFVNTLPRLIVSQPPITSGTGLPKSLLRPAYLQTPVEHRACVCDWPKLS